MARLKIQNCFEKSHSLAIRLPLAAEKAMLKQVKARIGKGGLGEKATSLKVVNEFMATVTADRDRVKAMQKRRAMAPEERLSSQNVVSTFRKALPDDRQGKMAKAAKTLMAEGVNTPEGLAELFDGISPNLRPYSQTFWSFFTKMDTSLPKSPDWQLVYDKKDGVERPAMGSWVPFSGMSSLGIPRDKMPQIKSEQRGALANFLKARGIDWSRETVSANSLKPSQAEYSPAKVEKAKKFDQPNRAILVAADGYVVDGHHQWMAALEKGEEIDVVRLGAPIDKVLATVSEFPSAETAKGEKPDPVPATDPAPKNNGFVPLGQVAPNGTYESANAARTKRLRFKPVLVDLAEAGNSKGTKYQPREIDRVERQAKVADLAARWNPELAAPGATIEHGPIVVTREGGKPIVRSGHHREAALNALSAEKMAEQKAFLKRYFTYLGQPEAAAAVDGMKVPALASEIVDFGDYSAESDPLLAFVRDANPDTMSRPEQAIKNAGVLRQNAGIVDQVELDDTGEFIEDGRSGEAVLSLIDLLGLRNQLTADGRTTPELYDEVRRALLAYVLDADTAEGRKAGRGATLRQLLEDSGDNRTVNFTKALVRSAGVLAQIKRVRPDFVGDAIAPAVQKYVAWKKEGGKGRFREFLEQSELFDSATPDIVTRIGVALDSASGVNALRTVLETVIEDDAYGTGLFGDLHSRAVAALNGKSVIDPRVEKQFGADWKWGFDAFGMPNAPQVLDDGHPLLEQTHLKKTVVIPPDHPLVERGLLPAGAMARDKFHKALRQFFRDQAKPLPVGTRPTAFLMGGGGGAGKTTIKNLLQSSGVLDASNAVSVNADDIKEMIPEYMELKQAGDGRGAFISHEESSMVAKNLLNSLLSAKDGQRYNVIYDATLANGEKGVRLIQQFKGAGFDTHLIGVTIDPEEALVRAALRAVGSGRWVPTSALVEAHAGFNSAVESYVPLVDKVNIYDNTPPAPHAVAEKTSPEAPISIVNSEYFAKLQSRKEPYESKFWKSEDLREGHRGGEGRSESGGAAPLREIQQQGERGGDGSAPEIPEESLRSRRVAPDNTPDLLNLWAETLPPEVKASKPAFAKAVKKEVPAAVRPATKSELGDLFDFANGAGYASGNEDPIRPNTGASGNDQSGSRSGKRKRPGDAGVGGGLDLFDYVSSAVGAGTESPGDDGVVGQQGQTDALGSGVTGSSGGDRGGDGFGGNESAVGVAAAKPAKPARPTTVEVRPRVERPAPGTPERNFRFTENDRLQPSGTRAKLTANLAALDLLRTLESEDRLPAADEKRVLARYSGWGALSQVFDERTYQDREQLNSTAQRYEEMVRRSPHMADYAKQARERADTANRWHETWGEAYERVRDAMSRREWEDARDSTINAHFSAPNIIGAIWRMISRLGFKGGNVLEPASGIGHFFGLMPESIADRSRLYGVELDSLTSRIFQKLYPEAKAMHMGYQETAIPPGSIDLAVSNVPFANIPIADETLLGAPKLSLHNYFFAKALQHVRPGGLVVFITTAHTMDSNAEQRRFIAQHGDLVAAVRLPNTAFRANAGTDVVTDIIILRKPDGTKFEGAKWRGTKPVVVDGGGTIQVNEYFADNPEMVLGRLADDGSMYGGRKEMTVHRKQEFSEDHNKELDGQFARAIERMPENIMDQDYVSDSVEVAAVDQRGDLKPGMLYMEDGQVRRWKSSDPVPQGIIGENFVRVRTALNALYRLELSDASDEDIESARRDLNREYDRFVRAHGNFHEKKNQRMLAGDPDFYRLAGLEVERKAKPGVRINLKAVKVFDKAPVFTRRVMSPSAAPDTVATLEDAITASMGWRGALDVAWMAQRLGETPDSVKAQLDASGKAFLDPATGNYQMADAYLSGNVRAKLAAAKAQAAVNPEFQRNVAALEVVQPEPVTHEQLGDMMNLGASWIPPEAIKVWLRDEYDTDAEVTFIEGTNEMMSDRWVFGRGRVGARGENAGSGKLSIIDLVDYAANMQTPTIKMKVDAPDGGTREVFDQKATEAAKAALDALKESFNRWAVNGNEKIVAAMEKSYNERHNSYKVREYDGSHLTMPWVSKDFELFPAKKHAVWRAVSDRRALFAHGVGGGKTIIGTAVAMEMKRLGLAKKPLIVVHNATLEQFAESIGRMAPTASVLVARKEDLEGAKRKEFYGRIASGDWDIVVMAHSTFNLIPDDPEAEREAVQEVIDQLRDLIREEGGEKEAKKNPTVKEWVKQLKRLTDRLGKLQDRKQDDVLTFQELGLDALILDESHLYKKLPFVTKLTRVAGIDTGASQRGTALLTRARWIQQRNRGGNVFTMTGTPVTNTLGETWNAVRLIAPDLLRENKVTNFDAFVSTFAKVETKDELGAGGKYKRVNRLANLVGLPEWNSFFRQVADVKLGDDMSVKNRPGIATGGPQMVTVPQTEGVRQFIGFIRNIAEDFERLKGKEKKEFSYVPLTIYSAARAASIDLRLVDPNAPDEPGSKVNAMVKRVLEFNRQTAEYSGTQVIFADSIRSVKMDKLSQFAGGNFAVERDDSSLEDDNEGEDDEPAEGEFNLYVEIKRKLVEGGMKPEEVALISEAKTPKAREKLFAAVNEGRVRVVIGSTQKLGTGVNMQRLMIASHQLDVPWTPADIEQRDGRVYRQGNIHGEQGVNIHLIRYGMEDTLDAALWQKQETKMRMTVQALSGKTTARSVEDDAGLLSAQESKALLSGAEGLKLFKLGQELRELEAAEGAWQSARQQAQRRLSEIERELSDAPGSLKRSLPSIESMAAKLAPLGEGEQARQWQVDGRAMAEKDAIKAVTAMMDARIADANATMYPKSSPSVMRPLGIVTVNGVPLEIGTPEVTESLDASRGKWKLAWPVTVDNLSVPKTGAASRGGKAMVTSAETLVNLTNRAAAVSAQELSLAKQRMSEMEGRREATMAAANRPFDKAESLARVRAELAAQMTSMRGTTAPETPDETGPLMSRRVATPTARLQNARKMRDKLLAVPLRTLAQSKVLTEMEAIIREEERKAGQMFMPLGAVWRPVPATPADDLPREQMALFSRGVVSFGSGIATETDAWGAMLAGAPMGTTVQYLKASPKMQQVFRAALAGGNDVFVDSGAFSAFMKGSSVDFEEVFSVYEELAKMPRKGILSVVAPDKIGDQQASAELLRKHADAVRSVMAQGVRVIVPVQYGEMSMKEYLNQSGFGADEVAVGIPANKAGYPRKQLRDELRNAGVRDVHFLGMSDQNKDAKIMVAAARQSGVRNVTMDANRIRSHAGRGILMPDENSDDQRWYDSEAEHSFYDAGETPPGDWQAIREAGRQLARHRMVRDSLKQDQDRGLAFDDEGDLFAESPLFSRKVKLAETAVDGYFDFYEVTPEKQKQHTAAKRSLVRAVSNANGRVDAAKWQAEKERALRAWRGLIGGDSSLREEALAALDQGPVSSLLHGVINREIPGFDVRGAVVQGPADLHALTQAVRSPFVETLKLVVLGSNNVVVGSRIITVGSLNETTAHPREIVAGLDDILRGFKGKVIGFMISHNHPSGDPSPSNADRQFTRRLNEVAGMYGIPLLDHVVTNGRSYFSFREHGLVSYDSTESPAHEKMAKRGRKTAEPPDWQKSIVPGDAAWEVVSTQDRPNANSPDELRRLALSVQTSDPEHAHLVYLDTRLKVLAVERVRTGAVIQQILAGAGREGAFGVSIIYPDYTGDEQWQKEGPNTQQRADMRRLQEAANTASIRLIDLTAPGWTSTARESGLLREEGGEYGAGEGLYSRSFASMLKQQGVDLDALDTDTWIAEREKPGQFTVGSPDLALGASDPRIRAIDENRMIEEQTFEQWNAEAREMMRVNYDGKVRSLMERGRLGETLNPVETRFMQMAIARESRKKMTPAQVRRLQWMVWSYRLTGTEAARGLAARRDPHQTPADRAREFLMREIFKPTPEEEAKVTGAVGVQAKDAAMGESGAEFERVKKELARLGITLDDLFSGEVGLTMKGSPLAKAALAAMGGGMKQKAAEMLMEHKGEGNATKVYQRIAKATGMTIPQVQAVHEELRMKAKEKTKQAMMARIEAARAARSGLRSRQVNTPQEVALDIDALLSMDPAQLAAAIDGLADNLVEQMGILPPAKLGKMKTVKRKGKQKPLFRAPAPVNTMATDEQWSAFRDKPVPPTPFGTQPRLEGTTAPPWEGGTPGPGLNRRGRLDLEDLDADETFTGKATGWGRELWPDAPPWEGEMLVPVGADLGKMEDVVAVARAIQIARATPMDMVTEWWINNLLSGPTTHVRNLSGNLASMGLGKTLYRGVESLLRGQPAEMKHLWKGLVPGLARGWRLAKMAWVHEADFFRHDVLDAQVEFNGLVKGEAGKAAIPGEAGRVIRWPGRFLGFVDSLFKGVVGQMEAGAQAYRIAVAEGLSGDALSRRMNTLVANPGSQAWELAVEKATETTFQQDLKKMSEHTTPAGPAGYLARVAEHGAKVMMDFSNSVKLLKWIVPFIRTPYNVLRAGIRLSPVGSLTLAEELLTGGWLRYRKGKMMTETHPALIQHAAEQLIAWSAALLLAGAVEGGDDDDEQWLLITGTRKKGAEGDLQARTYPATSVRIWGHWFNYGSFEPVATTLSLFADAVRAKKTGSGSLISSLRGQIDGKTFLKGLADAWDNTERMAEGKMDVTDAAVKQLLTFAVPNLIRQPMREADGVQRDWKSREWWYDAFPLASGAAPRVDQMTGEEIQKPGNFVSHLLFPFLVNVPEQIAGADRMLLEWNRKNPEQKYAPDEPSRKLKIGDTVTDLGPRAYEFYQKRSAVLSRQRMPGFRANVDERTKDAIKKAVEEGRAQAREELRRWPAERLVK